MSDSIHSPERGRPTRPDVNATLREDLQALRATTGRDPATLDQTIVNARRRLRASATWEERFMSTMHTLKRRPWLATAGVVAAIAAVLLVIPVSYERTTGHEVALSVTGPNLGLSQIREIAQQMKAVLGVGTVMVRARAEDGAPSFALTALAPAKSGVDAEALARAFAAGLTERGYVASAEATPHRERAWGSVYAYARDRVIRVSVDGKSAAQLEAEVRQRLSEAGVPDASVSITEADGGKKLEVRMKQVRERASAATPEEPIPQLELTKGGAPIIGQGFTVEIMKKRMQPGGLSLVITVNDGPRSAKIEVPNADSKGDAAIAAEISSQLQRAGIEANVKVEGESIQIERKQ